jgi:hypothetical protein
LARYSGEERRRERRRDAIQPAFNALIGAVTEVFPVELQDVEGARDVLLASLTFRRGTRCMSPS